MLTHAVILAIGNQNHRSNITYDRTYAMLPALGKPLVARIMDRLYRIDKGGIKDFTIVIGEDEGAVASYLNNSWMPDVKIKPIIQFNNQSLLEILQNIAQTQDKPFITCSYNCFTHNNFTESLINQHLENPKDVIITASTKSLSQSNKQRYHAQMNEQRIEKITTTPSRENVGLSLYDYIIFGQDMIDYLKQAEPKAVAVEKNLKLLDIVQQYLETEHTAAIAETAWTLQIEADKDLLTLNKLLLDEGQDAHILSEIPYTVDIIPPVRIDPQTSIGQGAKIGPHVYLERGSSIGHDAVVRDAIVLTRASVPAKRNASGVIITTRGPVT